MERKFGHRIFSLAISAVTFVSLGPRYTFGPQVELNRQPARIQLKAAQFDPVIETPNLARFSPMLHATVAREGEHAGTYLVQFAGPVQDAWKAGAERAGARLHGYIPENAFVARLQPGAVQRLASLPYVRWVGPYLPAYAISEPLLRGTGDAASPAAGSWVTASVQLLPDADMAGFLAAVARVGGTTLGTASTTMAAYLHVHVPAPSVEQLATQDGVMWIEQVTQDRLANDSGVGIVRVDEARSRLGLFGAGQVVAVADTGLDVGTQGALSPDVNGRVQNTYCLGRVNPCDWSDPDGHGTHVAGSVLGSGAASGSSPQTHAYSGSYAGIAPEARLVFQSLQDANGRLGGIPINRGALMSQAYADGARIHSNSWGGPTSIDPQGNQLQYGGYALSSQQVDLAAWDHKDLLILFAAGNQAADANQDGVMDADSIGQPGTAKNVLTVGASENEHPTVTDVWGAGYGVVAPILNTRKADNRSGMTPFSSRGPTDDGRIKPDLVAPGSQVISMRSRKNTFESTIENNSASFGLYAVNGGTANWQLTTSGRSAPNAFRQAVAGTRPARSMTVLALPELNLETIGASASVRLWDTYRLTGDNQLAIVFTDPTDRVVSIRSSRTGVRTSYAPDEFAIPISALAEAGLNVARIQVGFALYSDSGIFNSEWQIDDILVGPSLGSLTRAGLVPVGDSRDYAYGMSDGTSMATPLTAGTAALLREWLIRSGLPNPSAALLKAALMNGAADMRPGQYGPGITREIPDARPNNVMGWGRLDLMNTISPAGAAKPIFIDGLADLKTGEAALITITVGGTTAPASVAQTQPQPDGAGMERAVAPRPQRMRKRTAPLLLPLQPEAAMARAGGTDAIEQLVANGGFEASEAWSTIDGTFTYATSEAHGGSRSAKSTAGVDSYLYQLIAVPADVTTATLEFHWKNIDPDAGFDDLQVFILDESGETELGSSVRFSSTSTNWQFQSLSFAASLINNMRGQTVTLEFDVIQDDATPDATFFVDDVSLFVSRGSSPATSTPTQTPTPSGATSTATHTPTPTTAGPTATHTSTSTPTPTATAGGPTATPTATATATASPTPTSTPTPGPMAITLAWTGYPGEPAAAKALVNDLDLEITDPDGAVFRGNAGAYAAGHACLRTGLHDACNNVETVYIAAAKPGVYRVVVRSAVTAKGAGQPFALVGSGQGITLQSTSISRPAAPASRRIALPMVRR